MSNKQKAGTTIKPKRRQAPEVQVSEAQASEAQASEAQTQRAGQKTPVRPVPAKRAGGSEAVLLSSTPAWLNWAAVMLAVLIVAGVFLLSARQLNAPQSGISANQMNGILSSVGGMLLDADGTTDGEEGAANQDGGVLEGHDSESMEPQIVLPNLEPGQILMNPGGRVQLYADADMGALFLDSYARGGTFVVVEPTGDFEAYPVVVERHQWVRVRAADGLVGWAQAVELELAP